MKILRDPLSTEGGISTETPPQPELLATETPKTPESPVETPLENESVTPSNAPVSSGFSEKIVAAGNAALTRLGFKKGPGRPKKCRSCDGAGCEKCNHTGKLPNIADSPMSETPVSADGNDSVETADAGSSEVDRKRAELFSKACVSAVKGILKIAAGITKYYAIACGMTDSFAEKALSKAAPKPEDLEDFSKSLLLVLKKHNCQPKHTEEFALATHAVNLLAPYGFLIAEMRGELQRLREERANHPASGGAK